MTELNVSATPQETVHAAAEYVASLAEARALDQGRFTVALSGGSTPRLLYEMLAIRPDSDRIMWDNWQVFWSDERCVPPGHMESNYRMAKEALLDQVPISAACIYRVRGEIEPHEAAEEYEALIKNVLHVPMPSFHLILLGVGEDGHTASLFPGTQAMDEKDRLVAANPAPSGGASCITFTLPLINAAKVVAFLVTGGTKAEVLQQVLQPSPGHPALPASLVRPDSGKLVWFMDRAAASQLKEVKV